MRLLAVVFMALLAPLALAEEEHQYARNYDLDSTDFIYCRTTDPIVGLGSVSTVGSSTTVTNSGTGFAVLQAGDEIYVPVLDTNNKMVVQRRVVDTPGNPLTLTVAADWPGTRPWTWRRRTCGTGAEDGWWTTALSISTNVTWQIEAMTVDAGSAGILVQVECRDRDTVAIVVYPDPSNSASTDDCKSGTFSAANSCKLIVTGNWSQCRVGLKIDTADDGADAVVEDISVFVKTESLR